MSGFESETDGESQLFKSECCGTVTVPASSNHDDIVEAERGTRLVLERTERHPNGLDTLDMRAGGKSVEPKTSETEVWERVHRVTRGEASMYDAMRAGECPTCGEMCHGLTLLGTVQPSGDAAIDYGGGR